MSDSEPRTLREIVSDGDLWGAIAMAIALCGTIYFVVTHHEFIRRVLTSTPFG